MKRIIVALAIGALGALAVGALAMEIGPFEQAQIDLSIAPKRVSYEPASSGSSTATGAWEHDHNFIDPRPPRWRG
jgi:hypothetical protein